MGAGTAEDCTIPAEHPVCATEERMDAQRWTKDGC